MDTVLDYKSIQLNTYRSSTHDAINIFGFSMKHTQNGAVKAKMSIKDGLRLVTYMIIYFYIQPYIVKSLGSVVGLLLRCPKKIKNLCLRS